MYGCTAMVNVGLSSRHDSRRGPEDNAALAYWRPRWSPGSGLQPRCSVRSVTPTVPATSLARARTTAAAPLLDVRDPAGPESAGAVPVLVVLHGLEAARRRVVRGSRSGQVEQLAPPEHPALDAVLFGRLGLGRLVKAAEGDVDRVLGQIAEGQRRAAVAAEGTLGRRGAPEQRGLTPGPGEPVERDAGCRHEDVADGPLAHPAVADVGRVRLGVEGVAHRAALAAAG